MAEEAFEHRKPGRGYRFTYLARKHGLSHQEARELIARVGHDRVKLDAEARSLAAAKSDGVG